MVDWCWCKRMHFHSFVLANSENIGLHLVWACKCHWQHNLVQPSQNNGSIWRPTISNKWMCISQLTFRHTHINPIVHNSPMMLTNQLHLLRLLCKTFAKTSKPHPWNKHWTMLTFTWKTMTSLTHSRTHPTPTYQLKRQHLNRHWLASNKKSSNTMCTINIKMWKPHEWHNPAMAPSQSISTMLTFITTNWLMELNFKCPNETILAIGQTVSWQARDWLAMLSAGNPSQRWHQR